jgi:hypothetical protein
MKSLLFGPQVSPESGDLVLARIDEIGKQRRIELTDGRRAHLFPGDEVVVCFGNRYAPDQYEGVVGEDLSSCDLIAAGGIAAREISRNERMIPSTRITPLGLIGDTNGRRLNLRNFALTPTGPIPPIKVVLSLGTSMNAGKTFTSTSLVRGLKSAGYRVAAIKATGTGAGNDLWIVRDAGADVVLDFTDGGLASTYLIPLHEIAAATKRLIHSAAQQGCDVAVVEVADGLQHLETSEVIHAEGLWDDCVGVVFAAYDSMGAKCGVDTLRAAGHNILAISGRLTQSPLMVREAEKSTGLRVYTPWELQDGALTSRIMGSVGTGAGKANNIYEVEVSRANHESLPRSSKVQVSSNGHHLNSSPIDPAAETPVRDLLRNLIEKVMAAETAVICGAGLKERRLGRLNRRSGYRSCSWKTVIGQIDLSVPKVRKGGYKPAFLHRNGISATELAALVLRASASEATPFDLERLLERIGVTQSFPGLVPAWSHDLKERAKHLGLDSVSIHRSLAVTSIPCESDSEGLLYKPSIKEEYGIIGGYDDDFGEMDPFVSVETRPLRYTQVSQKALGKA